MKSVIEGYRRDSGVVNKGESSWSRGGGVVRVWSPCQDSVSDERCGVSCVDRGRESC